MRNRRRTFAIVVITLTVIFGCVAGVWIWNIWNRERNDPKKLWDIREAKALLDTSTWATCDNDIGGFRFKYPSEWRAYGEDTLQKLFRGEMPTSTCRGKGVEVTASPIRNIDGDTERTGQRIQLYARPVKEVADSQVVAKLLSMRPTQAPPTDEEVLNAQCVPFVGTESAPRWRNEWFKLQNGTTGCIHGWKDGLPSSVEILHAGRMYGFLFHEMTPPVLQTILSTFEFIPLSSADVSP